MLDKLLDRLDARQRRHAWLAFPYGVIKKFGDDQAGNLAALVAYYTFFSIFPLLLVLTTVLGWVLESRPELQEDVVDSALAQFPVLGDQLRENVGGLPGSGLTVLVGVLLALWAGMGATTAMQNALNAVWDVPLRRRPNFVMTRLRSLAMLAVIGLGLVALTVLGGVVRTISEVPLLGGALSIGVTAGLGVGLFLLAFRLLTDTSVAWRDLLPGAVLAAVAWGLLQSVGAAYVSRQVAGASSTAGIFAVVIGLLSWLFIQAQITVLAAELNVVRREHLWPRSLTGRHLTEGDQRALARYAGVEKRIAGQSVIVDLRPPATDHFVRTPAPPDPP